MATKQQIDAYRAAYSRVEAASGPEERKQADAALRAAEAAIGKPVIQAVWATNVRTIQDAKTEVVTAVAHAVSIERRCFESAARRNPDRPILNAEERRMVAESQRAVHEAMLVEEEAKAAFKRGVTADQLEAG